MLQDAKTALKKVPGAGRGGVNRIPELEVWPCLLGGGYSVDKGEGDQAKDLFGEWQDPCSTRRKVFRGDARKQYRILEGGPRRATGYVNLALQSLAFGG